MELFKKSQINKKIINEIFPSKIKIKNKKKYFNHNILPNDIFDISKYQFLNAQTEEGKGVKLKKTNMQPVNFYISSINKVYNSTNKSINIGHQNNEQKFNNRRKLNNYYKNKINSLLSNNNNTYQIMETNYDFNINNDKNRNSLKEHIVNFNNYFDNENCQSIRTNHSLNKSNDIIPFKKLFFNKNFFHNLRTYSGDNKKNFYNQKLLKLIRNTKASIDKKPTNNQNIIKISNLNTINDHNLRFISDNNRFINKKTLNNKIIINLKKKKKNENLELETIEDARNGSYLPYTYRDSKGKKIIIKNFKLNPVQSFNQNTLNPKFCEDKKKLKISFFLNLKKEINNQTIDKTKKINKHIFDYVKFDKFKTNNSKINKKIKDNPKYIETLGNEQPFTYRNNRNINGNYIRTNPLLTSLNNIIDSENNVQNNENNTKTKYNLKKDFPPIYKKRCALSPFMNKKMSPLFFTKKEENTNSGKKTKKNFINKNIMNQINKSKAQFNFYKIKPKNLTNNLKINNTNKDLKKKSQINQSKSCQQIDVYQNFFKNFLSQVDIKNQKEKKMQIKNPNILGQKYLTNNKVDKKAIIDIKKNSSICKGGDNESFEEKKINQDNLFKTKFEDLDISFYGICDGHGEEGHLVSEFIKIHLPLIIYKEIKSLYYLIEDNNKNEEQIKAYFSEICKQSFDIANKKLISNKNIDSSLSGSTCISLLFYEDLIISANLGDSRAIMGKLIDNKWTYELLSRDHNLSEIDEVLRIKYKNGEIHPFLDEDGSFSGPNRVWIKGQGIPGLAMTRSFGDIIGSTVGVINEPEIKFFKHKKENKFIIIGSDGLWEYISCQEAINIVAEFYEDKNFDSNNAVIKLFQEARNKWIENQNYIDDISIIVLFLE